MDIELENFTKQSEDLGKEIFDFCKLTWDPNTLNFYKRKKDKITLFCCDLSEILERFIFIKSEIFFNSKFLYSFSRI